MPLHAEARTLLDLIEAVDRLATTPPEFRGRTVGFSVRRRGRGRG